MGATRSRITNPARLCRALLASFLALLQSTSVSAQGLYPRGDATCDVRSSAADIVATLHGLGGNSTCDNDDCDRDGTVGLADAACARGCVFADCPVPAHAPLVGTVAADSAAAIVPLSSIRITGQNFGDPEQPKRVLIGGQPAGSAEVLEDGSIEVTSTPRRPAADASMSTPTRAAPRRRRRRAKTSSGPVRRPRDRIRSASSTSAVARAASRRCLPAASALRYEKVERSRR